VGTIVIRESAVRRGFLLLVFAVVLLAAAACGGGSEKVPSDAIAVVDGQTVAKADLDRLFRQARANSRASGRPFPKRGTAQYSQIRDQLVQFLVRRAQLAAEADRREIDISEQVEQRQQELVEQYFGGNEALYAKRLKKNGLTEEQARADLEASLIQDALFEDVGVEDVKVSEAEMRRHYRKNRQTYATPAQRELRQILLKPDQAALARELAEQLRLGASFEELARRYSTTPTDDSSSPRAKAPRPWTGSSSRSRRTRLQARSGRRSAGT
jgi:parvulin-like peptidyl-prolyl isomerase